MIIAKWFDQYRNQYNKEAGRKIVWYTYLVPQMIKELNRYIKLELISIPTDLIDWNTPQPDPVPYLQNQDSNFAQGVLAERKIAKQMMGDPWPLPNLQSPRLELEATIALRDNINILVADLSEEIDSLHRVSGQITKIRK